MNFINTPGLEKQELVAQITAYYVIKELGMSTGNVSLEFAETDITPYIERYGSTFEGGFIYGVADSSIENLHVIHISPQLVVRDIITTVAHELRHVWQKKNGWVFDFDKPYMEQEHEIDAFDYMYKFAAKYTDIIYAEYLEKRDKIVTLPDDWNEQMEAPPEPEEIYYDYDYSV